VSQQSISNWLHTGFLQGEHLGRGWFIPADEVERVKAIRRGTAHNPPSPPTPDLRNGNDGQIEETGPATGNSGQRGYNSYEAARLLGVRDVTILDWLKKGKLKGEKIDRNWSIPPAEIERIKNSRG
jgi:excisionase family DNA binding protein